MGIWSGGWLHDFPDEGYDIQGRRAIVKNLCFGPLETRIWYRLRDGRYCREIHFLEGPQEGELYSDYISKSEMLRLIEAEISLCEEENEPKLAALLREERNDIMQP